MSKRKWADGNSAGDDCNDKAGKNDKFCISKPFAMYVSCQAMTEANTSFNPRQAGWRRFLPRRLQCASV